MSCEQEFFKTALCRVKGKIKYNKTRVNKRSQKNAAIIVFCDASFVVKAICLAGAAGGVGRDDCHMDRFAAPRLE